MQNFNKSSDSTILCLCGKVILVSSFVSVLLSFDLLDGAHYVSRQGGERERSMDRKRERLLDVSKEFIIFVLKDVRVIIS